MGKIRAREKNGRTYYVYQESYRVRLAPTEGGTGKGAGKSVVRTKIKYLGTAEKILAALEDAQEPISVSTRGFGLVAAAYQTAIEMDLPKILREHLPGMRSGIARWMYFLVAIINRLDDATSKNRMSQWFSKTILPDLLGVNARHFSGNNFWYAVDDIQPQKEFDQQRRKESNCSGLFQAFREDVFTRIEMDLFSRIDNLIGLSPRLVCYDTTNFYTYIEEPKRSELAKACHSKDSKHHLKHIGLLMAVEKEHGIPLLSQIYQANRHDSRIFSCILAELIVALRSLVSSESDIVIVLDKGNNSEKNFKAMHGEISWVGALAPSHHKDLMELDSSQYDGTWKDLRYRRISRNIMGIECAVLITYNSGRARKQEHSLQRGIERLKKEILDRWNSYKKTPRAITRGIASIQEKSDYGACLKPSVGEGGIRFELNEAELDARRKRFGKNIIFSDMLSAESSYLIETYRQRSRIETDFQLLKDETIIRFRPIRHWTDTKIRAHAFCCVMALTLMRVMQCKAHKTGHRMSPMLLKEELGDIKEVVMVYDATKARTKITDRSTVQEKLWQAFRLDEIQQVVLQ